MCPASTAVLQPGPAEDVLHCRWRLHANKRRQLLRPSLTLPGGPSRVQAQRGKAQRSSTKCHWHKCLSMSEGHLSSGRALSLSAAWSVLEAVACAGLPGAAQTKPTAQPHEVHLVGSR